MSEELQQGTEPEVTTEDTLSDAYDRLIAEDAAPDEESVAAERARDERGRFAPKQQVTDQGEAAAALPEQQASPAVTEAPQSWSAAAKAEWAKIPPTLQQEIAKRESDVARGFQQYATALRFFEPVARSLEPIREQLVQMGNDPSQYLAMLVESAITCDADPVGFIKAISDIYSIDLAALASGAAQPQPQIDPQINALQQRIDQVQGWLQREEQSRQQQVRESIKAEIERFSADPQHKYYNYVVMDMANLLKSGVAADMEDAYRKAIRMNDQVLDLIQREFAESQQAERDKKLAGARRAKQVSSVRSGPGASINAGKTFDETLNEVYDSLMG